MNEWQNLILAVLLVVMAEIANEIIIALFRVKNATTRFRIRLISLFSCFFVFLIVPMKLVELTIIGGEPVANDFFYIDPSQSWGARSALATSCYSGFGQISLILLGAAVLCFVFMLLFSKRFVSWILWCEPAPDSRLQTIVDEISQELGVAVGEVMISWKKCDAFVYGYPPVLAVGKDLLEMVNDEELRIIVRHELHHIKGKDTLLKPLLTALCIIFAYNPMAWILYRKLFSDRECFCDYAALTSSQDAKTFLSLLLKLNDIAQGKIEPCDVPHTDTREDASVDATACSTAFNLAIYWMGATKRVDSLFSYEKARRIPVLVCFVLTFSSLFVGGTQLFQERYVEIESSGVFLDYAPYNPENADFLEGYFADHPLAREYREMAHRKETGIRVGIPLDVELVQLLKNGFAEGGVTIRIGTSPIGRRPQYLPKNELANVDCQLIMNFNPERGVLVTWREELKSGSDQQNCVLNGIEIPI